MSSDISLAVSSCSIPRPALLGALLLALGACRDSTGPVGDVRVQVVPSIVTVRNIGDTVRLVAAVVNQDGVQTSASGDVAWSSADTAIATVSTGGLLTARAPGSVTVTATLNGTSGSAAVTVPSMVGLRVGGAQMDIGVGDSSLTLLAMAQYSDGPAYWTRPVTWTVRDTSLISVDSLGRVRTKGPIGSTFVLGAAGTFVDSTMVVVWRPAFYLWPDTNVVPLRTSRSLGARRYSSKTGVTSLADVAWSSLDPSVATVDAAGLVTPVSVGHARIVATRGADSATSEVYVTSYDHVLRFSSVGTGFDRSCGLDQGNLYCWGDLGDLIGKAPVADRCETTWTMGSRSGDYYARDVRRCAGSPVLVPNAPRFASLMNGPMGITADGAIHTIGTAGIASVAPGYQLRQATSDGHTCAVGLDDRGYCWGSNWAGTLGNGTAALLGPWPTSPQAVVGNLRWTMIFASRNSTCGIAIGGQAYCWGWNYGFHLGVGPDSTTRAGCNGPCVLVPTPVQGTASFTTLASRAEDTCAATSSGETWCWGAVPRTGPAAALPHAQAGVPVLVKDAPAFESLDAAGDLCGVTTVGELYCLKRDPDAADLGSVYAFVRQPLPFTVSALSMGTVSTCVTARADGRVYCWGNYGVRGNLGDGRLANAPADSPVLVAGQ